VLYDRIVKQGTVGEPDGKPDPQWALPSSVNWMASLRLLTLWAPIDFSNARAFFAQHGRRSMAPQVENTVLEQLFLSLHHLSALRQMAKVSPVTDVARISVLAWYYGISNAASAMIAAEQGSFQEDHAGTARMYDTVIASRQLAMGPFGWRVSTLVEKEFKPEVNVFRDGNSGNLQNRPSSLSEATAAAASYLSGSAKFFAARMTEEIRSSQDFRKLGVDDFRTRSARELRDKRLAVRSVGFLHQAIRYRGKANYREALYMAHGKHVEAVLKDYVTDLATVLQAFLAMAGAFASRKLGKELWAEFVADVDAKRSFSTGTAFVWS
jgi:hypothetical protein